MKMTFLLQLKGLVKGPSMQNRINIKKYFAMIFFVFFLVGITFSQQVERDDEGNIISESEMQILPNRVSSKLNELNNNIISSANRLGIEIDENKRSETLETTFNWNNGHIGNYFQIDVLNPGGISITNMAGYFKDNGTVSVSVRDGAIGSEPGTGWNQVASVNVSVPLGQPKPFIQSFPVVFTLSQGSYTIHFSNTNRVKYSNGSGLGNVLAQNSDLIIYEGYGTLDISPNQNGPSGYSFSPRNWNGSITYNSTPAIISTKIASDNSTIAVIMSEAVYNTNGGSGALEASDFSFSISGGVATLSSSTPTSITPNGNVYTLGLGISGMPNGSETVTINPVDDGIYDIDGNEASTTQSNNTVNLNDKLLPIITGVSLSSDNSVLTVTMSEAVYSTNGGSGDLDAPDFIFSLSSGSASLTSVTPTNINAVNLFTYELGVGLSGTSSGETLTVNPVDDSIYDVNGNEASTSQSNNTATLTDLNGPMITSVSSSTADGLYKIGEQIAIEVTVNESVVVTGTPQLTLETGATDAVVNYSSGSGSNTLVFNYTIASGDINSDLEYQSTSALALNGGTIKDASGNASTITLPTLGTANSLAGNKALVVDGVVPTFMQPPLTSIANNNTYIDIVLTEAVYNASAGSGALEVADFTLTFAQNSGNATGASISSVKQNDNVAEGSASALAGGEIVIRAFLSITGTPSGVETITITPVNATSIYDLAGNAMPTSANVVLTLNDQSAATITDVSFVGNRTIQATFSEAVFSNCNGGALEADDFVITFGASYAHITINATPTIVAVNGNIYTLALTTTGESYVLKK